MRSHPEAELHLMAADLAVGLEEWGAEIALRFEELLAKHAAFERFLEERGET